MTWLQTPAGAAARRTLKDLLREADPLAYGSEFKHPQSLTDNSEPAPLAAVRGARELALACQRLVKHYALDARGAGETWEEVAVALGLRSDGRPDSAAAYLSVLGVGRDDPWWSPARGVVWTCTTCQEAVRDYGPECGGPDDRESGHGLGCSRHTAEVVAWEALWA